MMLSAVTDPEGTKERQEHKLKRRIYHSKVCMRVCCVCVCVCVCVLVCLCVCVCVLLCTQTPTHGHTQRPLILLLLFSITECNVN